MKKKRKTRLTPEFWQRDAENQRYLARRIEELGQKIAEQKAARERGAES